MQPGNAAGPDPKAGGKRPRGGFAATAICTFGLTCLIVGACLRLQDVWFLRTAAHAMGHYTDESGDENSHGGYDFVYFVVFRPASGDDVTFTASTHDHQLPEKTPLPILYDPRNPAATARLASEPTSPIGFELLSIGLPAALVGGLLVRAERQRLRDQPPVPSVD